MKYLFSKTGTLILESLSFTSTLYAFDFDGTLAPIVSNPSQARMANSTLKLIEKLNQLVPIAVISGRNLEDLKKVLAFRPTYLIGNHGLEGGNVSKSTQHSSCEYSRLWLKKLIPGLQNSQGIEIENKTFSLAIHYRKSRKKVESKLRILELCSCLHPSPRIIMGKCVVNLVPVGAPHKGMALLELMVESKTKNALYIGDDDTDEDVFSLPESRILSIRVGKKKHSHAQYFIERQTELNHLLRELINNCKKNLTQ